MQHCSNIETNKKSEFNLNIRKSAFTLAEVFSKHLTGSRKSAFTLAKVFSPHFASNRKSAFTLAEVLITLGIIGVVAAMTLPNLIANYQEKQFISSWKKLYSEISNTALRMKYEGEDIRGLTTEYERAQIFAKYINHLNVCQSNKLVEDGCAPKEYSIYSYNGRYLHSNIGNIGGGASCVLITNGSIICFDSINILVDVNGYKKPNKIGRDIFVALLNPDDYTVHPAVGGLKGWGPADDYTKFKTYGDGTCQDIDYGFGCSSALLSK